MSSACAPNSSDPATDLATDPTPRFGIAFGSNVGDRLAHLSLAKRRLLAASPSPESALFSPVFESAPVDCAAGSTPFFNAVAEIALALSPARALALCHDIEAELGRPPKHARNSPRSIDLDLLYAGSITCDTDSLQLPHPRLAQRRFVLEPLAIIRPKLTLPGSETTVADLLQNLFSEEPPLRRVADQW